MSKTARVDQLLHRDWDSFCYDLVPEEEETSFSPEERLFLAVIIQAVDDATSLAPSLHRDQARGVIFSASATPLKDMCDFLDIDYPNFRSLVKRMIDEGRTIKRDSNV
jgi:hypothetical protein